MKCNRIVFLIISFIPLFSGCNNKSKIFDKFYENEKNNIINLTNEIFSKLGLDNFEIIVYTHKNISNKIISKNISNNNWHGSEFVPEPPPNNVSEEVVFKGTSEIYGNLKNRTINIDYEPNSKKEISYGYFSIIIIFKNINQRKKDELLNIFDSYILNIERGDTVVIISKEEFNNLE
jgi:hypothetical protein